MMVLGPVDKHWTFLVIAYFQDELKGGSATTETKGSDPETESNAKN